VRARVLALALLASGAVPAAFAAEPYREVGASITGASDVKVAGKTESKLSLQSSEPRLVTAFEWAKRQSLAFAYDVGDPVGPWYEAAEPGREAFCMRDTAHQAMGAHALGLARHNKNMLRKFAAAVSDARDWCSFWEIDRYDRPAPVDYRDDAQFWYNLPANFDVLDCCYRMYLWTGDGAYVEDPAFLHFYERSVNDYVERWGLALDKVMTRPRLLNVRGLPNPENRFQLNRGIPGYHEQETTYTLGVDVLATQYAGYMAYSRLMEFRGEEDRARRQLEKAAGVKALVNSTWWNEAGAFFYNRLDKDHKLEGRAGHGLLYRDVVEDGPKTEAALREGRSLEVMYRYGDPDAALDRMLEIAHGTGARREYPEVPFSWVGNLVNGTMGINLEAKSALQSRTEGFWVATTIRTLSGLGTNVAWAELGSLPVRANEISVRHDGTRKTTFTNLHGPALIWLATFAGTHETLLLNGRPVKARQETGTRGRALSALRITLGGGGSATVQVP
jgi:hypothetical protein